MEHNLTIVILLDIYGELLAGSQRQALDLRYNADFSLAEIAEEMGGISRQSVSDSLKKGEQRLLELESKLGLAQRLHNVSELLDNAQQLVTALDGDYKDERFKRLIGILSEIKQEL